MHQQNSYREIIATDHGAFHIHAFLRTGQLDPETAKPHWHAETELVLSRRGEGIQQIGSTMFALTPGNLSVISSGLSHCFLPASAEENFDLLVVQFQADHFLHSLEGEQQFCSDWCTGRLLFDKPIAATDQIYILMELIYQELQKRDKGSVCAVEGALRLLLVLLYRKNPARLTAASSPAVNSRQRMLVDPAMAFLAEHYQQEDLSVEQAAAAANLSVTHFCRLFKRATGMGFHEYLTRYRIVQAERLFTHSMSLTEIAYACGFGSSSSFLRNFKKYRGISPQVARKQYK